MKTLWIGLALASWMLTGCGDGCHCGKSETGAPVAKDKVSGAEDGVKTETPLPEMVSVMGVGFSTPESALYDASADIILVSNVRGGPLNKDDDGFISRINVDGSVEKLGWINGMLPETVLNAPKGMALHGTTLYVSDIDEIRTFHRETGESLGSISVPGSTFLNDLVAGPDGSLYCSDSGLVKGEQGLKPSGTDAIYKISPKGTVSVLAKGSELGRPNGLLLDGDLLWVVTFGSGELYSVNTSDGSRSTPIKLDKGTLDGLVKDMDGDFLISSWEAKAVYKGPSTGPFMEVVQGFDAPADIGWDSKRHRLLIPLFNDDALDMHAMD